MSNNVNPYQPSSLYSPDNSFASIQNTASLPSFCKAMFIASLVLSILRIFIVTLSIIGMLFLLRGGGNLPQGAVFQGFMFLDVIIGAGIAVLGITANTLLLLKKRVGLLHRLCTSHLCHDFAWASGDEYCDHAQGVMQVSSMIPMLVGAGATMAVRLTLLVAYFTALHKFKQWYQAVGLSTLGAIEAPASGYNQGTW